MRPSEYPSRIRLSEADGGWSDGDGVWSEAEGCRSVSEDDPTEENGAPVLLLRPGRSIYGKAMLFRKAPLILTAAMPPI